ncbi:hypothetical protein V492_05043, partial [Pseudogymnoascus sp. VKM F-4246]
MTGSLSSRQAVMLVAKPGPQPPFTHPVTRVHLPHPHPRKRSMQRIAGAKLIDNAARADFVDPFSVDRDRRPVCPEILTMMRPRFAAAMGLRLLLLALAVSGTSAIQCDFSFWTPQKDIAVSNQEELESLYAGCTTIDGTVKIAANYTGDFYLPNVTDISGGIRTEYIVRRDSDNYGYQYLPVPLLTSIVAPDLNNTGIIHINTVPALTTISFPSLTVLGEMKLVGFKDCSIDFPVLKTSGDLIIAGNNKRLNFPKLANVALMRVSTNASEIDDNDTYRDGWRTVDPVNQPPIDINFPELQTAYTVYLQGNITSLSLPQLVKIGDGPQYYDRFFKLLTYGNPLDISLPRVYDLKEILLGGTIGSISFPVLKDLETFEVNTTTPLNVTLEPIRTISKSLRLIGDIVAVSMTSITDLSSVSVHSDSSDFYCNSIASEIERILGPDHSRQSYYYNCTGHVKSKLPLILGLSIGLGVPLILAFVGYRCWRRRTIKKRQEAKANKLPGYELGVPPVYSTDGPPT